MTYFSWYYTICVFYLFQTLPFSYVSLLVLYTKQKFDRILFSFPVFLQNAVYSNFLYILFSFRFLFSKDLHSNFFLISSFFFTFNNICLFFFYTEFTYSGNICYRKLKKKHFFIFYFLSNIELIHIKIRLKVIMLEDSIYYLLLKTDLTSLIT